MAAKLTRSEWRMLSGLAVRSTFVGWGDERALTLITHGLATRSVFPELLVITDAGRTALSQHQGGTDD